MLRLLIILSCNVVGVFSFANRSGILRGCEKWPHQQHAPLPPLSLSNGEDAAINSKPKRPKEAWVLVVEDEDDLRCAIGTFLSKRGGYHVTGVSDARSAIILCRGMVLPDSSRGRLVLNSDTNATYTETCGPDCLVLDVRLGSKSEMDGLELLKKIRCDPVLEGLPVVLLTAKGNIEDRINGYKAGADAYLPKPFSPEELLVIVNGFMQMKNKLPAKRMDVRSSNTAKNGVSYSELKTELKEIKSLINQLGLPERQPDSSGRDKNAARSLYSELVGLKEDVKQIIDARSDSAS